MGEINLVDFYYNAVVGNFPENEKEYNNTKMIFDYLLDSGCELNTILKVILYDMKNKEHITIDDLPDIFWEGSLLKRDTFYFHRELQILSPPPTLTESFPFYLEMKIRYTKQDVLNYFMKSFQINNEWIDQKKELGSISYLLDNYKKFGFIEPVDFLLHLIDYVHAMDDIEINSVFDLRVFESKYVPIISKDIECAKASHKNRIIWRMDVCGI